MSTEYKRERKEEKPVLAICYDFDKTLSPDDMQAQGFIQSVGYDVETFWKKSNGLASGNDMDQNLAYMLMMQQAAEGKKLFTRGELMKRGSAFPWCQGLVQANLYIWRRTRRTCRTLYHFFRAEGDDRGNRCCR